MTSVNAMAGQKYLPHELTFWVRQDKPSDN